MKKIKVLFIFTLITTTSAVTSNNNPSYQKSVPLESNNSNDSLISSENFKFAEKAFKFYNETIDTSVVLQLIKVCDHYKLNKLQTFKMCVGQLLVESGGKHYKNGEVVVGSGGHIGMCQISPKSGLAIMQKCVTDSEFSDFKVLTNDTTLVKPKSYSSSVTFLKDVDNNLTFWAYLLNRNIGSGSIEAALIKYNAGPGGYLSYINSGGSVNNHHYIRKIRAKLSKIN